MLPVGVSLSAIPMTHSESIPLADVRALMNLVGDLGQFPAGTAAWRRHFVEHVGEVIPCQTAQLPEIIGLLPGRPAAMVAADTHGWISPEAEHNFFKWSMGAGAAAANPMIGALGSRLDTDYASRRVDLIADDDWDRVELVQVMRELNEVDDMACSVSRMNQQGWAFGIGLQRRIGDRPFSARDRNMLELLAEHLGRSLRRALVPVNDPKPLSPRLRQTLEGILEGHGDKQIAAKLELSYHTVREYIKELYARFNVSGRNELILACLASKRRSDD